MGRLATYKSGFQRVIMLLTVSGSTEIQSFLGMSHPNKCSLVTVFIVPSEVQSSSFIGWSIFAQSPIPKQASPKLFDLTQKNGRSLSYHLNGEMGRLVTSKSGTQRVIILWCHPCAKYWISLFQENNAKIMFTCFTCLISKIMYTLTS